MSLSEKCIWLNERKIVVNPDGQVWPCCYLCNTGFIVQHDKPEYYDKNYDLSLSENHIFVEYLKYKDELNLKNVDLVDILNHKWFNEVLPNSWKDEKITHKLCKKFCQVVQENE